MTKSRKNEIIYVALALLTAIGQLTWVQIAYNDPSTLNAMTAKAFIILSAISFVFVATQTLIAWKAYLSDPNVKDVPREIAPPGSVPPMPKVTSTETPTTVVETKNETPTPKPTAAF
jgi:hypothetical protein